MSVLDEVAARPTEERRRRRYLFDRERVLGPALLLPAVL